MHLRLSKQGLETWENVHDFIWCCHIHIYLSTKHVKPPCGSSIFTSHIGHIYLQIGKAVQKMNDLSRPVYLKSMDEEKHKPNDVLWNQLQFEWSWAEITVFELGQFYKKKCCDIFSLESTCSLCFEFSWCQKHCVITQSYKVVKNVEIAVCSDAACLTKL